MFTGSSPQTLTAIDGELTGNPQTGATWPGPPTFDAVLGEAYRFQIGGQTIPDYEPVPLRIQAASR